MSDTSETVPSDGPSSAGGLSAAMMFAVIAVAAVAIAFSVGAIAYRGLRAGAGVASGGLLATLNLWAFAYVGRGVLGEGSHRRFWGLLGGLKFVALLAITFALLKSGQVSGIMVAIGYGSLPVGVAIGNYLAARPDEVETR